jgi:hypothetical protein
MTIKCTYCNDTGSSSRTLSGHLDCGYCDVAVERAQFEAIVDRSSLNIRALLWTTYQMGKQDAVLEAQTKKE